MITLQSFTDQVHKMRLAQERVTHLASSMTEFDSIRDAEIIAKNLEKQVDQSIQEIKKAPSAAEGVAALGSAMAKLDKSYFATENF